MEQFIRHLLCDVLSRKSLDNVLKMLRKLQWDDVEVGYCLWTWDLSLIFPRCNGSSIRCLQNRGRFLMVVLRLLRCWHMISSDIILSFVWTLWTRYSKTLDWAWSRTFTKTIKSELRLSSTSESFISTGLSTPVSFLIPCGALSLLGIVSSPFDCSFTFSPFTFKDEGRPLPGQVSVLDAPDDFFRIRLVCTLLDACGMCFDRGSYKRKLDRFLNFFQVSTLALLRTSSNLYLQLYIFTKDTIPMDVDFMITDTFEVCFPNIPPLQG